MAVASAILDHYDAAKRRRGLLDFEDLVERTRNLLATSSSAWVLYKLDKGIDHILVDEAQDTNEAQWTVIRALTGDFFAGAGRTWQLACVADAAHREQIERACRIALETVKFRTGRAG